MEIDFVNKEITVGPSMTWDVLREKVQEIWNQYPEIMDKEDFPIAREENDTLPEWKINGIKYLDEN